MKELSDFLKSERVGQGLSLKEVSERCGLSVGIIQALEDGDFERIGTALLIRNFVRSLSSALGVDPEPLLEKYESEILSFDQQDAGIRRYGIWSKGFHGSRRMGLLTILAVAVALVGVLYGGAWYYNKQTRLGESTSKSIVYPQQEYPADLPESEAPPADVKGKQDALTGVAPLVPQGSGAAPDEGDKFEPERADAQASVGRPDGPPRSEPGSDRSNPAEVLAEEKPVAASAAARKHVFEVYADQKTWIQVKIKNKAPESVLMEPGQKRAWDVDEGVDVIIGNAGGVQMKWDGKPFAATGKPGQVLRFHLPDPQKAPKSKTP